MKLYVVEERTRLPAARRRAAVRRTLAQRNSKACRQLPSLAAKKNYEIGEGSRHKRWNMNDHLQALVPTNSVISTHVTSTCDRLCFHLLHVTVTDYKSISYII